MDAWLQQFPDGGVEKLYESIQGNPTLLDVNMDASFVETPLHMVVRRRRSDLVLEILKLIPSQGQKLNPQGHTPLHIAILEYDTELACSMVMQNPELSRVAGREGKTPLHCAAEKDMVRLLFIILDRCPDSIEDLTVRRETALHVALKSKRMDALENLCRWVERNGREEVFDMEDCEDKTLWNLATESERIQLKRMAKRLDVISEYRILRYFTTKLAKFIKRHTAKLKSEAKDAILVVAVLIATATFQAVLSPPRGDSETRNGSDFTAFAAVNTIAFSFSLAVILLLVPFSFYNFFLYVSVIFFTVAYILAIKIVWQDQTTVATIAVLPYIILAFCYFFARQLCW